MAWVTPRTYVTGETITASILNTDIRENFRWRYSPPSCRVWHAANQDIAYGDLRYLNFDTTVFDTDAMHAGDIEQGAAPAAAFVNIKTAGRYHITACVDLGVAAWTQTRLGKNNPQVLIAGKSSYYNSDTDHTVQSLKTLDNLAVGDFLYVLARSSQNPTLAAGSFHQYAPVLSAHWLGN